MKKNNAGKGLVPAAIPALTIGLDVGDRYSKICGINRRGEIVERLTINTTRDAVTKRFTGMKRARIVLEVGTHSPWLSRLLAELGNEVIVANAREVRLISQRNFKSDDIDAETLARLGRVDPELLAPITHRGRESQIHLVTIRARDTLVRARSRLIVCVRCTVKSIGHRLPKGWSAEAFAGKFDRYFATDDLPADLKELKGALEPLVVQIRIATKQIGQYDAEIERLCCDAYRETELFAPIKGVGSLTALAFVLLIEDPSRFSASRKVGSYVGLVPKLSQSGDRDPQGRITKAGDKLLRRLLVQCAHYILGPYGEDCDLRSWGLKFAERGGKNAKKRAVVAVARKLAVTMHHLWATGAIYDPLYQAHKSERRVAVTKAA
jgi:transposase